MPSIIFIGEGEHPVTHELIFTVKDGEGNVLARHVPASEAYERF